MAVQHYRDLIAWQKAMDLTEAVYRLSRRFPPEELCCLTSQIRRCAISVPSNISEGQGRGVGAEFAHHLRTANGSPQEVETQALLARRLGCVTDEQVNEVLAMADEVGRLIAGLHRSVAPP